MIPIYRNPDPDKTLAMLLAVFLFDNFCTIGAKISDNTSSPPAISNLFVEPFCYDIPSIYDPSLQRCCRVCPPGSGVIRSCSLHNNSECAPCPLGYYSTTANHHEGCHKCPFCPSNSHQIQECSAAKLTECECDPGYFINAMSGICERCDFCQHGFGALVECNPSRNTVCERCPNGTFSDVFALDAPCQVCRNCTKMELMTKPCTAESNSVCGDNPECSRMSIFYHVAHTCEYTEGGIILTFVGVVLLIFYLWMGVRWIVNHTKRSMLRMLKAKTVRFTNLAGRQIIYFQIDSTKIYRNELFPTGIQAIECC